jgi:hypothetical protein
LETGHLAKWMRLEMFLPPVSGLPSRVQLNPSYGIKLGHQPKCWPTPFHTADIPYGMCSTVVKGHLGEAHGPFHTTEFGCVFHMTNSTVSRLSASGKIRPKRHTGQVEGQINYPTPQQSQSTIVGLPSHRILLASYARTPAASYPL